MSWKNEVVDVTRSADGRIRCDACPVMCYIRLGEAGACDRYANAGGTLIRVDPVWLPDAVPGRGASPHRRRQNPGAARPGTTLPMTSTTGEHAAFFELDEALRPVPRDRPAGLQASMGLIQDNCEPALASVVFMAGAGGSLRSGVTENPVRLTRSVRQALTRVTCGGAPVALWPGGGITFSVDVTRPPAGAFGSVPTPARMAPIEFTLRREDYAAMGGHLDNTPQSDIVHDARRVLPRPENPWPLRSPAG